MTSKLLHRFSLTVVQLMALLLGTVSVAAITPTPLVIRNEELLRQLRTAGLPRVYRNLSLSPAGDTLVFVESALAPRYEIAPRDPVRASKSETIWILDLKNGKKIPLLHDEDGLARFRTQRRLKTVWSTDGRSIALLERDTSGLHLHVFDARSGGMLHKYAITSPGADGMEISDWQWRSMQQELVLIEQPVDPVSQSIGTAPPAFSWALSQSGPLRDTNVIAWRRQRRAGIPQELRIVALASGSTRTIFGRDASDRQPRLTLSYDADQSEWRNWRFLPDQRRLLFTRRDSRVSETGNDWLMWLLETRDPRGAPFADARSEIFELNLDTSRIRRRHEGGPGAIGDVVEQKAGALAYMEATPEFVNWPMKTEWGKLKSAPQGVSRLASAQPLRSRLYPGPSSTIVYGTDRADEPDLWAFRIFEHDLTSGRSVTLTPDHLRATSWDVSADGTTIAAVLESVSDRPAIALWSSQTRKWKSVVKQPPSAIENGLGEASEVEWSSGDGLYQVNGILVKPLHWTKGTKCPLIVSLRGGHNMGTAETMNWFDPLILVGGIPAQLFAAAGYAVLLPNHRGVDYTPLPASQSLRGHYGAQIPLDVEKGIDYLVSAGIVDPERIGIYGQSNGSAQVGYAISHSTRYKAAVIEDGPGIMPSVYLPLDATEDTEGPSSLFDRDRNVALFGFDPVAEPRRWLDPFAIRTPLLLRWGLSPNAAGGLPRRIASLDDLMRRTTYGASAALQTSTLLYALRANDVPMDVIIDRDKHWTRNPVYLLEWQSRVIGWFDYFLLGKGEPPIPARPSGFNYPELRGRREPASSDH
ncbi:MAG TPA: prolyl oligopeptidase family serine peptidase [Terriglobales bacterium]|nr:prolyl oligopeptidase family serine peptidase [Terriglobales bacterium]